MGDNHQSEVLSHTLLEWPPPQHHPTLWGTAASHLRCSCDLLLPTLLLDYALLRAKHGFISGSPVAPSPQRKNQNNMQMTRIVTDCLATAGPNTTLESAKVILGSRKLFIPSKIT